MSKSSIIAKKVFTIAVIAAICTPLFGQSTQIHVVKRGETFASIAAKYGISESQLLSDNPNAKSCFGGMKLTIVKREPKVSHVNEPTKPVKSATPKSAAALKSEASTKSSIPVTAPTSSSSSDDNTASLYLNMGRSNIEKNKFRKASKYLHNVLSYSESTSQQKEEARKLLLMVDEAKKERRKEKWRNFKEDILKPLGKAYGNALLNAASEELFTEYTNMTNDMLGRNDDGREIYRSGGKSGFDAGPRARSETTGGGSSIDQRIAYWQQYGQELDNMMNEVSNSGASVKTAKRTLTRQQIKAGAGRNRSSAQHPTVHKVTLAKPMTKEGESTYGYLQRFQGKLEKIGWIRSQKNRWNSVMNRLMALRQQGVSELSDEDFYDIKVEAHNRVSNREDREMEQWKKRKNKEMYDSYDKLEREVKRHPEYYSLDEYLEKIEKYEKKKKELSD